MESGLDGFKARFPDIEVEIVQRNGQHPYVRGHYGLLYSDFAVSGLDKTITVKNRDPGQVENVLNQLRSEWGTRYVDLLSFVASRPFFSSQANPQAKELQKATVEQSTIHTRSLAARP